jgi:hypothetical protein
VGDQEDERLRAAIRQHRDMQRRTHAAKTHYFPGSALTDGEEFRLLWVYRDLRDVLASTCHYAIHGPAKAYFASMTKEDAFEAVVDRVLPVAVAALRSVAESTPPSTLLVRYEKLHAAPVAQIERIAQHLDIELPEGFAEAAAARHHFRRESGRDPGDEDVTSYHRSGLVGSWKTTLPETQQRQIKTAVPDLDELMAAVDRRATG